MERIPSSPPQIAPVANGVIRPLWSVMIPAYNCSAYLAEAIKSVLLQDIGPAMMQIEVIDDCSIDTDVEKLVAAIGKGRVSYYKQKVNVGSLRNFETCIKRSKGHYIHLLHGDDRVKPGYYASISNLFKKFPDASAAFCAWDNIDADGKFSHRSFAESKEVCVLENWLFKLAESPRLQYAAMTVKREVYEALGGFYLATYGEDWEMWARIAKHYQTAYTPEVLAEYREHQNSITSQSHQTGQHITDLVKVINKINSYLPQNERPEMLHKAKKNLAYWIMNETFEEWRIHKDKQAAYSQIKAILLIYKDGYLLSKIVILLFTMWLSPIADRCFAAPRECGVLQHLT